MPREKDEETRVEWGAERIPCENCVWASLNGPRSGKCMKYRFKPSKVYFKGEDCPEFEEGELDED